jgi:uncharacterized protein (TIGR03067 family)
MLLPASHAFCLLLATAVFQPEPPGDKAFIEELKRLQGSWQVELQEENGEKLSADDLKGRTILFGKNAIVLMRNNQVLQISALKLDPSKSPRTANAMIVQGKQKGDIMLGIYALDGDVMKICFDPQGQERPKDFKTTAGSGHLLIVCKRIRAKGEDEDLAGDYKSETLNGDGSKIVSDAIIDRVGDAYLVTYKKGQAVVFVGIGLRKGDVFCLSWINQGQIGVSLYQIEKGPKMVGYFTQLGGPGLLGQETLTRAKKILDTRAPEQGRPANDLVGVCLRSGTAWREDGGCAAASLRVSSSFANARARRP